MSERKKKSPFWVMFGFIPVLLGLAAWTSVLGGVGSPVSFLIAARPSTAS